MSVADAVTAGVASLLDAAGAPAMATSAARLTALKSKLGRKGVADRLGLTEHELGRFEAALSEAQRWREAPADAPRRGEFLELASLAAYQWLEVLCPRLKASLPEHGLLSSVSERDAAARVRALELVMRELIHESYKTQGALATRLAEVFRPDTVQRWERAAAGGDALTGMSFGDLASFFVAKEEYPRWQPTLEVELWLAMLRDRRKTLREYLDVLRLARNALAHHKPLTMTQRLLVERYSDEIFSPISRSWADGRTSVNPKSHLEASSEGLAEWVAALRDDVDEIRDELAGVKQDLAATKKDVSALEGAVVLMLLSGVFFIGSVVATMLWSMGVGRSSALDVSEAGAVVARSSRGMLAAALTFGLAIVRIGLNVVWFRSGGGAGMRGWLTGRRALVPLGVWSLACGAFYVGPIRLEAVQAPYDEAGIHIALVTLEPEPVQKYLDGGGDPNKVINGRSALELALAGATLKQVGDDERRARIVAALLAKGAKVTPEVRKLAKATGREALLPR